MKGKRVAALLLSILLTVGSCTQAMAVPEQAGAPQKGAGLEEQVNLALSQMTLRDRARLTLGGVAGEPGQSTKIGNQTKAITEKGLGYMTMSDGPMGCNVMGHHTSFGSGQIIASTWNPDLVYQVGEVIGKECVDKDIQYFLGPGTNINRDLINGRTFEYYSEDPYLSAQTVAPYVQGVQSMDVAATVKHLMANNQEMNRNFMSSNVSERAMHELYLPAFQASIEQGDAWSVMTAANRMNGVFTSDNRYVLTNLVKYDYGMRGVVITDWINTRTDVIAAKAGLDLAMPYSAGSPFKKLESLIRGDQLDVKYLNEASQRFLRLAHLTKSMINTDEVDATGYTAADRQKGESNTPANQAVARKVAEEGIVLLKNESGTLPLDKDELSSIALLGKYVNYNFYVPGLGGSGATNPPYQITNLQGLQNKLGGSVELKTPAYDESNFEATKAAAVEAAKNSDYAIVFAGLNSTTTSDPNVADTEDGDRDNLDFPPLQLELINAVAAANPKTIVVLSGSMYEVRDWVDNVPAVLQTYYPGMEGGNAVADILLGNVNPSGKLTNTWPKRYEDTVGYVPGHEGEDQRTVKYNDVFYKEGIYVGYKWNDLKDIEPEFAFGHGLSYTEFQYDNLRFSSDAMGRDDTITASVDVTNTGSRAGKETVQLYIHDVESSIDRPLKELKGYEKVALEPNETKTVNFTIDTEDLSYWDVDVHSLMAEKGDFEAWVGSAADDIRQKGTFTLTEDTLPDPDYKVVQAEDATDPIDAQVGEGKEVDGAKTGYLAFNSANSHAKWTVNAEEDGNYSVIFRYSNPGYNGAASASYGPNRVTSLLVNGEKAGDYDFQNTRWENVWNYDSIDVALKAGENTIELRGTDATTGLHLDKMIVQTIHRTTPLPSACAPDDGDVPPPDETDEGSLYQAEKATELNGAEISMKTPGYTGTGYVELLNEGSTVNMDVLAPTFNAYRLGLNYSNGNREASPCELYVNGKLVSTYTLPPTGGWTKWKLEMCAPVDLKVGLNQIQIKALRQNVYLDSVLLHGGMGVLDTTVPEVISTTPLRGRYMPNITDSIDVYFTEIVRLNGDLTIEDNDGNVLAYSAQASGNKLSILPEGLDYGKVYTVRIPKDAIADASDNFLAEEYAFTVKAPQAFTYNSDDANIRYSGSGWKEENGGKITANAGDAVTFWINGTNAKLTGPKGPDMGTASVVIDEAAAGTINFQQDSTADGIVYDTGTLSEGVHCIRITANGSIGLKSIDVVGSVIAAPLSNQGWKPNGFSYAVDSEPFTNVFDGTGARWSSGKMQAPGQWFTVDFGKQTKVNTIVMYTPNDDFIRGYEVYASNDGNKWGSLLTSGKGVKGYTTMTFPDQDCRYLKIVQTGSASNNWWCINEMYLFQQTFTDKEPPVAPEYLFATSLSGQIILGWEGASDDTGVTGYIVYRDGKEIGRTSETVFVDVTVEGGKAYTYSVKALDIAGNLSDMSESFEAQDDPTKELLPREKWIASAFKSPASASPAGDAPVCAIDGNIGSRWTSSVMQDPNDQWFMIDLGGKYAFNQLLIDCDTADYGRVLEIRVSNDGKTWSDPVVTANGIKGQTVVNFPQQIAQYVKINQVGVASGNWWAIFELNIANHKIVDATPPTAPTEVSAASKDGKVLLNWSGATDDIGVAEYIVYRDGEEIGRTAALSYTDSNVDVGNFYSYAIQSVDASGKTSALSKTISVVVAQSPVVLSREGWTATASHQPASATPTADSPNCVIDSNPGNRWTSGAAQAVGMWFCVDLGTAQTFSRLELDCQSAGDYIRNYELVVSDDGETWSAPIASGAGNGGIMTVDFPAQTARYLKIVSTGNDGVSWWSINELNLYNQPAPIKKQLTINFPAKLAQIQADGADDSFANLTGVYRTALQAGEEFSLEFTPTVSGREFASVTLNGVDVSEGIVLDAEGLSSSFHYSDRMGNENPVLDFSFTVVDKQILRQVLSIADGLSKGDEYATAIPSVQKAFDKALALATDVEANMKATQKEIDHAWDALLDAIHLLSFAEGDTSELEAFLTMIDHLNAENYTSASWDKLSQAADEARALIADGEPLQADVDKVYQKLHDAFYALEHAIDRSILQMVVDQAKKIDLSDYLEDGQEAFAKAFADAQDVLDDPDATAKEIETAADTLNRAMLALRKIPTRKELLDLIAEMEQIDLNGCTQGSVAIFKAALHIAQAAAEDPNADGKTLAAAFYGMQEAKDGLKEIIQPEKPSTGSSKRSYPYRDSNTYGSDGITVVNPLVAAAQNVTAQAYVRSDTTINFTLKHGNSYCFKMTVVNGSSVVPSFTAGNSSVLKTQFVAQIGNDYYYRVYAVGKSGDSTGVYTTLPGQNAVKHCAVTIG